jgi:RNase P subunit RPR2
MLMMLNVSETRSHLSPLPEQLPLFLLAYLFRAGRANAAASEAGVKRADKQVSKQDVTSTGEWHQDICFLCRSAMQASKQANKQARDQGLKPSRTEGENRIEFHCFRCGGGGRCTA